MIKKLKDLLAQVRAAEKDAVAIIKAGGVGSKIEGTVQRLRGTADEIEERIRLLKASGLPDKPEPKAPPAD